MWPPFPGLRKALYGLVAVLILSFSVESQRGYFVEMNFKVTTLCENNIGHGSKNLIGEHGLSFYVEADDYCILFDTGQNLAIANNAEVLGIDLGRIDTVILSHGHYDHSSGLKSLLDCNTNFTLCAHPDVFGPKLRGAGDKYKYIGIPVDRRAIEIGRAHV